MNQSKAKDRDAGMPCLGRRFATPNGVVDLNTSDPLDVEHLCAAIVHTVLTASSGAPPRSPKPLPPDLVEAVVAMIMDRPASRITVEDLASSTAVNRREFSRAFKAATGVAPHAAVRENRIDAARDLLRSTVMPLSEIALASRFSSQSHMTDVFSKKLGATPGRHRKEARS